MELTAGVLSILVGLSLGLLGGGGSILMVPLLVYVAKISVAQAMTMSLVIVGVSSGFSAFKYLKKGFVNLRLAVLFILPGVLFSFLGVYAAKRISAADLLFMFGVIIMWIAVILYKKSSDVAEIEGPILCRPSMTLSCAVGAGIGFLTGLLGVGGGFLIVPAIAILMKCSIRTAVGTSLGIMAVNSLAALAGHLSLLKLDIHLTAFFLSATMIGAALGGRMAGKLNTKLIQKIFSGLIFLVGILMVLKRFTG